MKIKLTTTVYFDGVPYPSGSIIDPDAIGANGDAIVHWMWGQPVDDDEPVAVLPIFRDPVAASVEDADPAPAPVVADPVAADPAPAPTPEPTPEPISEPTPEPPPAPRRKRK